MSIIKSKRNFGIEIELGNESYEGLRQLDEELPPRYRMVHDGSNQAPNPVEIVSPKLKGEKGEKSVRELCSVLKGCDMIADHPSCGFHVHVDGKEFAEHHETAVLRKSEIEPFLKKNDVQSIDFIASDVPGYPIKESYLWFFKSKGGQVYMRGVHETKWNGKFVVAIPDQKYLAGKNRTVVFYSIVDEGEYHKEKDKFIKKYKSMGTRRQEVFNQLDRGEISEQEATDRVGEIDAAQDNCSNEIEVRIKRMMVKDKGRYVVQYTTSPNFEALKNLLYFHVVYNPVFLGMLPPDRKENNAYCMALSEVFTPEEVEAIQNQKDFDKLWYKEKNWKRTEMMKNERYNDSRYLDVNFHSLFNQHGTIEIRSHGSTIDPDRILLWAALHQLVVDRCIAGKFTEERVSEAKHLSPDEKVLHMIDTLDPPEYLRKYITRLYNYFSETCVD